MLQCGRAIAYSHRCRFVGAVRWVKWPFQTRETITEALQTGHMDDSDRKRPRKCNKMIMNE